jgi:hypothetical protein
MSVFSALGADARLSANATAATATGEVETVGRAVSTALLSVAVVALSEPQPISKVAKPSIGSVIFVFMIFPFG